MKFVALIASVAAIRLTDDAPDHSDEFFEAWQDGMGSGLTKYERIVPERFGDEGDDIFMKSMIKTYALEGKNKDGSPNGRFWMSEKETKAATDEVLQNNCGKKGAAAAEWSKTYFPRTWAHFDVNKTGKLGVEIMPQFMRFICSDQTLHLS